MTFDAYIAKRDNSIEGSGKVNSFVTVGDVFYNIFWTFIIIIIIIIVVDAFSLLCAFGKLRKVTINFVMSVCPSVRNEHFESHRTEFVKI